LVVRAAIFDGHVMTLNEARFGEAGWKGGYEVLGRTRGPTVRNPSLELAHAAQAGHASARS
jgi:hypothetical protein